MAYIEWRKSFSVGISVIDEQHKVLISLINGFHDAIAANQPKEALGQLLDGLIQYTMTHFKFEEDYFEQFGYAGAGQHKQEHALLIKKVEELNQSFLNDNLVLSVDVMSFLKAWLYNHIQKSDKKYTALFKENGVE